MLDSKSENQSKQTRIDLELIFVRQLLDHSSRNLLTWQQIKIARGANCRGKVPLWFQKLEELLIDDAESHKVKEDFFSNNINISALQPHCGNVTSNNKRKQWIWFAQKNKKKWYLGRVTKILKKSALIEHWTEMYIQGDKCSLLKCGGCNLNTKGKKNECMISCNKNLIRDKPKYHLTPVQECPLLQLKEIDYAERELVKSQNFVEKEIKGPKCKSEDTSNSLVTKIKGLFQVLPTKTEALEHIWLELEAQAISLAWAHLKNKTRAVITLRDLCTAVLYKTRQEQLRARQDYIRGLVRQSTLGNLWLLLTSTKEIYDVIRALIHIYQKGFYRVIWVECYKKICEWENSTGITRVKKRGAEEM
ncbi:26046_t:CDS:2, partial [Gigaspora margarita]